MGDTFSCTREPEQGVLLPLQQSWRKTLTFPEDDMWAHFIQLATPYSIQVAGQRIGYAMVDSLNQLLQFYCIPKFLSQAPDFLRQFLDQHSIKQAIVGTNNPVFFSLTLHQQKRMDIHSYLFSHMLKSRPQPAQGSLHPVKAHELALLVEFCKASSGGPVEWLKDYLSKLIRENALFALKKQAELLGTCEVRTDPHFPNYAHLGIMVAPAHRRKGLGTYLLGKAAEIAFQRDQYPICSCRKENIASLKAIQANGFRSQHQLVKAEF